MKEGQKIASRLSFREKFSYGLGDVGNNFLFDMGQIYLLKFYTDSLGLPPSVAGMLFLITKLLDGFTDIGVGTWIDSRKKYGKLGKFRPFMLYATVPLALCTAVSFYVPDFELNGRIIWAYLSYALFGLAYTIFNIPYGSMIPAMTKDPVERSSMASFRWAGATMGLLITSVAFIPLVTITSDLFGPRYSYFAAASVFAVVGCILQLTCTLNVKERYVEQKTKEVKGSLIKSYLGIAKNAPLLILCLVNLLTFSAFNVKLAVQVYFCEYVLHDISVVPYLGFFSIGCVFIGIACVQPLVRRMGKKATYVLGAIIWGGADIAALFLANNTILFIIFACIAFYGTAFINTLNWALISDAVEYGEWKTGLRSEGVIYSFFTFFRKLSQALAGFIPGVILAAVGYVANQQQTPQAIEGIRGLMFLYPGALAIATFLIMYYGYKLTDKRYEEIVREMDERKKQGSTSINQ